MDCVQHVRHEGRLSNTNKKANDKLSKQANHNAT